MEAINSQSQIDFRKPKVKNQKLNLKVLVVEDDRDVASFTRHILQKNSFARCEVAYDCYEAIQELCEHKYDMILLDQNLPGMSGTEFLVKMDEYVDVDPVLSESSYFAKKIPVIVMSASKIPQLDKLHLQHFEVIDFIDKHNLFSRLQKLSLES